MKHEYKVTLVGELDTAKTSQNINKSLKALSIQDENKILQINKQLSKLTRERMSLEDKASKSRRLASSQEVSSLTTTIQKLETMNMKYKDMVATYGKNSVECRKYNRHIQALTNDMQNQKLAVNLLEKSTLTFWERISNKAKEYFNYAAGAMIIQKASQAVGEMINNVIELDSALVELRKVTDLEGNSLDSFTDKAYQAAESVAKTGTEMIQATTEFAKSGYDPNTALGLGQIALMYSNIADEAVSAGDAASFIIAQMKAFNIEADDAIHIIDAVNEVSNNFAVSSADIANNLGKASAVVANAGNSMEEYIAMMTAITEITRDASRAANGLKTMTLRLQGMNDEGEKDLEVQAKMEELFNKLGISVYNANGELKNTYDIMGSLAPVYQTLTNAEKAYVTETIAGKHQAQNAAALLNNWSQAVAANETAINSQGSAMNENAKVLDSIEGKINAFKSSFEELSRTVIDSDLIKGLVDLGTLLLKIANSDFVQFNAKTLLVFGSLKLLASGVQKIPTLFLKFSNILKRLKDNVKLIQTGFSGLTKIFKLHNIQAQINNRTKAESIADLKALGIATSGLTTKKKIQIAVNKELLMSEMALNAIFAGVSLLIMGGITWWQKYQEAQEEAIKSVSEEAQNLDTKMSDIDGIISDVQSLRATLDDSNSSYEDSVKAREDLAKIQQELRKTYGDEAKDIDVVTGSIQDQIKELKRLKQEMAQDYIDDNEAAYNTAHDKVYGDNSYTRRIFLNLKESGLTYAYTHDDENKKAYEQVQKDINKIFDDYGTTPLDVTGGGEFTFKSPNVNSSKEALEEYRKYLQDNKDWLIKNNILDDEGYQSSLKYAQDELNKIDKKFGDSYQAIADYREKLLDAKGYEQFKDELKELSSETAITEKDVKELINDHPDLADAIKKNKIQIKDIVKDYQNYGKVMDIVGDKMGNDFTKDVQEMIVNGQTASDDFEELFKKYDQLPGILDGYGMNLVQFSNYISEAVAQQKNWTNYLAQWNTEVDNMQSAFQAMSSAQDEYNENGFITIDTLQSLLSLDSQYLTKLVDQNGQINLNADAFRTLTEAKLDEMKATEEQRHYDALLALQEEINNKKTKESVGWWSLLWQTLRGGKAAVSETKKSLEDIEKALKYGDEEIQKKLREENQLHDTRIALIDKTKDGLKNIKTTLGASKSSSKSQKEWWEDELQKLKDQFNYNEITIEEYIKGLDKLLGKTQKGSEAWKKINEELQKQRLSKVEDDYKDGRISLEQYIAKLKELIKVYKQGTQAWNDLADKIKKGLQDQAKETKTNYDGAKSAIDKIISDRIEQLNKEKEALSDKNDEEERAIELARLQEALENARNNKTKRVWNGSEWVWMSDQAAIDDAQQALDDFNKETEIKKIDDEIDKLNDLKNQYADVTKIYDEEQQKQQLIAMLGANAEADVLNKRIDTLNNFKNKYLAIQEQIASYDKATPESFVGGSSPSISSSSSAPSSTSASGSSLSDAEINELARAVIQGKYGNGAARKSALGSKYSAVQKRVNQMLSGRSYASGGIVDYTGLAMLHGSPSKPEVVMNHDQVKAFMRYMVAPQTTSNLSAGGQSIIYNFSGDFNLPNVSNAKQFLNDLKSQVNITKHNI